MLGESEDPKLKAQRHRRRRRRRRRHRKVRATCCRKQAASGVKILRRKGREKGAYHTHATLSSVAGPPALLVPVPLPLRSAGAGAGADWSAVLVALAAETAWP